MFGRIADLIEWRKLRRAREGIDVAKLNIGDAKKKAKKRAREEDKGGLRKGATEDDACVPIPVPRIFLRPTIAQV